MKPYPCLICRDDTAFCTKFGLDVHIQIFHNGRYTKQDELQLRGKEIHRDNAAYSCEHPRHNPSSEPNKNKDDVSSNLLQLHYDREKSNPEFKKPDQKLHELVKFKSRSSSNFSTLPYLRKQPKSGIKKPSDKKIRILQDITAITNRQSFERDTDNNKRSKPEMKKTDQTHYELDCNSNELRNNSKSYKIQGPMSFEYERLSDKENNNPEMRKPDQTHRQTILVNYLLNESNDNCKSHKIKRPLSVSHPIRSDNNKPEIKKHVLPCPQEKTSKISGSSSKDKISKDEIERTENMSSIGVSNDRNETMMRRAMKRRFSSKLSDDSKAKNRASLKKLAAGSVLRESLKQITPPRSFKNASSSGDKVSKRRKTKDLDSLVDEILKNTFLDKTATAPKPEKIDPPRYLLTVTEKHKSSSGDEVSVDDKMKTHVRVNNKINNHEESEKIFEKMNVSALHEALEPIPEEVPTPLAKIAENHKSSLSDKVSYDDKTKDRVRSNDKIVPNNRDEPKSVLQKSAESHSSKNIKKVIVRRSSLKLSDDRKIKKRKILKKRMVEAAFRVVLESMTKKITSPRYLRRINEVLATKSSDTVSDKNRAMSSEKIVSNNLDKSVQIMEETDSPQVTALDSSDTITDDQAMKERERLIKQIVEDTFRDLMPEKVLRSREETMAILRDLITLQPEERPIIIATCRIGQVSDESQVSYNTNSLAPALSSHIRAEPIPVSEEHALMITPLTSQKVSVPCLNGNSTGSGVTIDHVSLDNQQMSKNPEISEPIDGKTTQLPLKKYIHKKFATPVTVDVSRGAAAKDLSGEGLSSANVITNRVNIPEEQHKPVFLVPRPVSKRRKPPANPQPGNQLVLTSNNQTFKMFSYEKDKFEPITKPLHTCKICSVLFKDESTLDLHFKMVHPSLGHAYAEWKKKRASYEPMKIDEHKKRLKREVGGDLCPCGIRNNHVCIINNVTQKVVENKKVRSEVKSRPVKISISKMPPPHFATAQRVQINTIPCDKCDRIFATENERNLHVVQTHVIDQLKIAPTEQFPCGNCNQIFPSENDRNIHIALMHITSDLQEIMENVPKEVSLQTFPCNQCNQVFSSEHEINQHIVASHTTPDVEEMVQKFPCNQCFQVFSSEQEIIQHIAVSHTTPDVQEIIQKFPCNQCNQVFLSEHEINQHIVESHIASDVEEMVQNFPCNQCFQVFSSEQEIIQHIAASHTTPDVQEIIQKFPCNQCYQVYSSEQEIIQHIVASHTTPDVQEIIQKFPCNQCNQVFLSEHEINQHIVESHITPDIQEIIQKFPCNQCNQVFLSEHEINQHIVESHITPDIQEIIQKFPCNECYQVYSSEQEIIQHIVASHTTPDVEEIVQNFPCNQCNKDFSSKHELNLHIAESHTTTPDVEEIFRNMPKEVSLPKFPCNQCDQVFSSDNELNLHIAESHILNKLNGNFNQFACGKCDRAFPSERALNTHVEQSHILLECELCSQKFLKVPDMLYHMEIHPKSARSRYNFICNLCKRACVSGPELTRHMQEHVNQRAQAMKSARDNSSILETLLWGPPPFRPATMPFMKFNCTHPDCGRSFKHYGLMRTHMVIKHELYPCGYCGIASMNKNDFVKHMEFVHREEWKRASAKHTNK